MTSLPRVRILSTGSEILQGLYPDTNAQNLSRLLFAAGFQVVGHGAAPDGRALIARALRDACADADLVVMTGGLGPTEDDVNRFVVAELWGGLELLHDAEAERMMRARFEARGAPMPERNVIQAMMPAGATTLYNFWGTAPGFFLPAAAGRPALMALPGPPSEWRPMFEAALPAVLAPAFPQRPARHLHTLHIALTPESIVNEALRDLFATPDGDELTILAARGHIRLRVITAGASAEEAAARNAQFRARVVERLGAEMLFADGPEDATLAEAVVQTLRQHRLTVATAESCTGGGVAAALTDVPGSSEVLHAGWVTYHNDAKVRELGVAPALLEAHGAVSEPVACAMAEGALHRSGAHLAVALTGIAGPGGGSDAKPVGTVWIALAQQGRPCEARRYRFSGTRAGVREWAVKQALELLRRRVLGIDADLLLGGPNPVRRSPAP